MLDKEMGTEAGEGYQLGSPDGSPCVSINPKDLSQDFSPCLDHKLPKDYDQGVGMICFQ